MVIFMSDLEKKSQIESYRLQKWIVFGTPFTESSAWENQKQRLRTGVIRYLCNSNYLRKYLFHYTRTAANGRNIQSGKNDG